MKRIFDKNRIASLAEKYDLLNLFSVDILPHLHLLSYETGEYIFHQNEELRYFYFILGGRTKIYLSLRNGKSLLLCFSDGLQTLGDAELLSGDPTSTNVQVLEPIYALGLPSEKIREFLLDDNKFLRYACSGLGHKLIQIAQNSSINLLYPLENRLASYILAISGSNREFRENLTEISELLGTSYRHLLRTLNSLIQKGALEKKGLSYYILDHHILRELASDVYAS